VQGRLLGAMETGQFRRVGGRELLSVDTRIVCASSKNLRQLVARNKFRADLYYRIAGIICDIPSLDQRRTDIPELANALLQGIGSGDESAYHLTDDAVEVLLDHDYPGNVRELGNILQHAASLSTNGIISAVEIRINEPISAVDTKSTLPLKEQEGREPSIKGMESQYIAELLTENHGKRSRVAQILGISERTLYRKLKQYGLQHIGRTD
jgi:two-component system response regulator AtoC